MLTALTTEKKKEWVRGHKETLELMNKSIILIVLMVSEVFACVQTHQIIDIKYVQVFV